ncbi:MAG: Lrp/AsnC family transcriptional regulator [Anaerolineae bacterium]|jgi:Lrp/AsnC family transcriptional regulator for asnA, asnC and gidA
MSENKLDEIDHQIIAALKQDGRMPFAEIARGLDVSPGMVRERYHRLVQSGVLQVVAVTNPLKVGYRVMTLIGIQVEGNLFHEVARQVAAFEEVIYLVLCTGTYDLLAEVVCRDNAHLLDFLTRRLRTIEGIHNTESFVYLDIVKEIYT